jgi:multiple sugar transport system ATP-binding protein
MASVLLENLGKTFEGPKGEKIQAVRQVNLEVRDRELVVLVGPSGCGKSTTLRLIAGLESVSEGTVAIDGRIVNRVPPKDRDIAMVFQNYALFPHLTVFENMAFGLKLRKFPKEEIRRRVGEAAEILGLTNCLDRRPRALSGGQRQRVAVGRAIVRQPKVFLFDEPLSNLDAKMRGQMRVELARLHHRLQATMIYVTHDQVEAMTMGDRIVVMHEGAVQQTAEPVRLYQEPANLFVAGFIGSPSMNFFPGRLIRKERGILFEEQLEPDLNQEAAAPGAAGGGEQETTSGHVRAAPDPARAEALAGWLDKPLLLGVRPEHVRLASEARPGSGPAAARVGIELIETLGSEALVHLRAGNQAFVCRRPVPVGFRSGEIVDVRFEMDRACYFEAGSGARVA